MTQVNELIVPATLSYDFPAPLVAAIEFLGDLRRADCDAQRSDLIVTFNA
jgi:hypothetical protein